MNARLPVRGTGNAESDARLLGGVKNRHAGGRVVILANGPSLKKHDLRRLAASDCLILGLNRSWDVSWPDYHMTLDVRQYATHPRIYQRLNDEGRLYVLGPMWPVGVHLKMAPQSVSFSHELQRDGIQPSIDGTGSVAYAALQLAAWMGFTTAFFLGLDLHGPHYHGDWPTDQEALAKQDRLFHVAAKELDGRMEVFTVGRESRCTAFLSADFDEVCA